MLSDSWNPAVLSDSIRSGESGGGSALPTPAAGDAGKVLTVNSELEWAAASLPSTGVTYSTSEVDTGDKWVDNKPIYRKSFSGTAGTSSTTLQSAEGITIIKAEGFIYKTSGDNKLGVSLGGITSSTTWTLAVHVDASNNVCLMTSTDTDGGDYNATIYYTKNS